MRIFHNPALFAGLALLTGKSAAMFRTYSEKMEDLQRQLREAEAETAFEKEWANDLREGNAQRRAELGIEESPQASPKAATPPDSPTGDPNREYDDDRDRGQFTGFRGFRRGGASRYGERRGNSPRGYQQQQDTRVDRYGPRSSYYGKKDAAPYEATKPKGRFRLFGGRDDDEDDYKLNPKNREGSRFVEKVTDYTNPKQPKYKGKVTDINKDGTEYKTRVPPRKGKELAQAYEEDSDDGGYKYNYRQRERSESPPKHKQKAMTLGGSGQKKQDKVAEPPRTQQREYQQETQPKEKPDTRTFALTGPRKIVLAGDLDPTKHQAKENLNRQALANRQWAEEFIPVDQRRPRDESFYRKPRDDQMRGNVGQFRPRDLDAFLQYGTSTQHPTGDYVGKVTMGGPPLAQDPSKTAYNKFGRKITKVPPTTAAHPDDGRKITHLPPTQAQIQHQQQSKPPIDMGALDRIHRADSFAGSQYDAYHQAVDEALGPAKSKSKDKSVNINDHAGSLAGPEYDAFFHGVDNMGKSRSRTGSTITGDPSHGHGQQAVYSHQPGQYASGPPPPGSYGAIAQRYLNAGNHPYAHNVHNPAYMQQFQQTQQIPQTAPGYGGNQGQTAPTHSHRDRADDAGGGYPSQMFDDYDPPQSRKPVGQTITKFAGHKGDFNKHQKQFATASEVGSARPYHLGPPANQPFGANRGTGSKVLSGGSNPPQASAQKTPPRTPTPESENEHPNFFELPTQQQLLERMQRKKALRDGEAAALKAAQSSGGPGSQSRSKGSNPPQASAQKTPPRAPTPESENEHPNFIEIPTREELLEQMQRKKALRDGEAAALKAAQNSGGTASQPKTGTQKPAQLQKAGNNDDDSSSGSSTDLEIRGKSGPRPKPQARQMPGKTAPGRPGQGRDPGHYRRRYRSDSSGDERVRPSQQRGGSTVRKYNRNTGRYGDSDDDMPTKGRSGANRGKYSSQYRPGIGTASGNPTRRYTGAPASDSS